MPFGTKVSKWRCENRKIMFGFLAFFSQVIFFTIVFFFLLFWNSIFFLNERYSTDGKEVWLTPFTEHFPSNVRLPNKIFAPCQKGASFLYRCAHYAGASCFVPLCTLRWRPASLYSCVHCRDALFSLPLCTLHWNFNTILWQPPFLY